MHFKILLDWKVLNGDFKKVPIRINSPICIHLCRVANGNDDSSSDAHLKSSQPISGVYLDLESFVSVKIFEFHLVTQFFQDVQVL
jgi:hypothetical protein